MSILWGPGKDLDYWKASAVGAVRPEESRAMTLLASLCNERRFSFYCRTGTLPAMGNVTKRIYLVRRFVTVVETDCGFPVATWCVVTRDRDVAPETDHVVALKNLIEGEETAFREVGNRTRLHSGIVDLSEIPGVYTTSFIEAHPRARFEDDWTDMDDLLRLRARIKAAQEGTIHVNPAMARRGFRRREQVRIPVRFGWQNTSTFDNATNCTTIGSQIVVRQDGSLFQ